MGGIRRAGSQRHGHEGAARPAVAHPTTGPSPEDAATLQAYWEGVNAKREEIERKWGVGRVEILASDELRAKWRRQQATWAQAYREAWAAEGGFVTRDQLQAVADKAGAMKRGYDALDQSAEEAGFRPLRPWVWETLVPASGGPSRGQDEGSYVAAVVQTDAEAAHVLAEGRYLAVYTLSEIANVLAALPNALQLAKTVFPGARFVPPGVCSVKTSQVDDRLLSGPWRPEGDEIPFGRELAEPDVAQPPHTEPEPWDK